MRVVRHGGARVLDQLDEDAARAAWVDEGDAMSAAADARLLVDQFDPLGAQVCECVLEGADREPEVMEAGSPPIEEPGDR